MSVGRGRGPRWRVARALVLLAAAGLLVLRVPLSSHLEVDFPHHSPDRLAHFLADFTNHPKLYAHVSGPWQVEEERSNLSWWRYVVSYECGSRCEGRVRVEHVLLDSHPHSHRVSVSDERCLRAPLVRWARLCSETDTETTVVRRAGRTGGARLHETRHARCSLAASLADLCGARDEDAHLRALRRALAEMPVD